MRLSAPERGIPLLLFSFLTFLGTYWLSFHSPIVMDCGILIDRSWRISQGQVPYRDFFCITTPLTFMTQGLLFKVLGPKILWMKLSLALQMAALIFLAGTYLVRIHKAQGLLLGLLLILAMAWLPGTHLMFPWYDVDGVFWGFAALVFLGLGSYREESARLIFLAGLCAGLSFLGKQNAGAASWIAGCAFIAVLPWDLKAKLRGLALYILGACIPVAALFVYLWSNAAMKEGIDWIFVRSTDRLGGRSTIQTTLESIGKIVAGRQNHFVKLLLVVYGWALFAAFKRRDEDPPRGRVRLAGLCYAAIVVGFCLLQDAGNRYPIFQVYLSVVFAVLFEAYMNRERPLYASPRHPLPAVLFAACAFMAAWGGIVRNRQASISHIRHTPDHPRLKGFNFRKEDYELVQGLLEFEKTIPKTEKVFIFPDPLFFYFAVDRMSPVPAVPFLVFSWDIRDAERKKIPEWLEQQAVAWAILGQENFYDSGYLRFGSNDSWKEAVRKGTAMSTRGDFSALRDYLDRGFAEVQGPKGFWVLKRMSP